VLLERSEHLRTLHAAADSGGVLVLLDGEAGGGKTALLRQFRAERGSRFLWGAACVTSRADRNAARGPTRPT
jgi:hypothetical protein